MEFGYGKRDGSYSEEKEEEGQEDCTNKHNMLSMASTCSSSSSHLHPLLLLPPSSSGAPSSSSAEAAAAAVGAIAKEHMFDKVATPSDVGKLNRLVIPKQHAERYFPLDHSANEKGLLLKFEDPTGKPWLFRYSYWNSSQSYVMTKGWSRFVKEKRLDTGDTVSFSRGVGESVKSRYFIDWKRRPEIHHDPSSRLLLHPGVSTYPFMPLGSNYPMVSFARSAGSWAGRLLLPTPTTKPDAVDALQQRYSYPHNNVLTSAAISRSGSGQYLKSAAAASTPPPYVAVQPATANATLGMPVVQQKAAAKRVTLFGVNLDFQESDRQHPYQRPVPLQLLQQQQQQQQQAFSSSSSSPSPTEQSLDLGL